MLDHQEKKQIVIGISKERINVNLLKKTRQTKQNKTEINKGKQDLP